MEDDIINWIREYVNKANARGVVIGNSGGKDSATVIALCQKALGSKNVLAVAMPCKGSEKDLEDGELVAQTFGVKNILVDLENVYDELEKTIDFDLNDESKINIKPRLRMTALYAIAQTLGYLVCRNTETFASNS